MRFRRLDLEAYGAFTSRSLAFRPDARVHVVYGPNEAGKSSALAAVSDLLFGFEPRTPFAFRHDMKELRLGAVLVGDDGREVAFRRRKGTKNTLIDDGDAPLRDDALAPFLGGLTREIFGRAFGLNAEALRAGADDLRAADGEAGATLLAASGARGLDDLRRTLEAEADGVFAPRASEKRRFYQALQRHDAARKAIRERELKAGDWKALNARIDDVTDTLARLKDRRRATAVQRARLARLARSAPLVRLIDEDVARIAGLGNLPDAGPAAIAELGARLKAAAEARETAAAAEAARAAALAEQESIAVDATLIAGAAEIARLFGGTGAYAKARQDLPRVEEEADRYAADLARLAARLGLGDAAAVARSQPSDAAQAMLRGLAEEGRRRESEARTRAVALGGECERRADLERQRGAEAAALDPAPFRERLDALAAELRPLERRDEEAEACALEARALTEAAARLSPRIDDLDALARRSLPSLEMVALARRERERLMAEAERLTERRDGLDAEAAASERELAELASGGPIPSPAAIAAERAARDGVWLALRRRLLEEGGASDGAAALDGVARHERHTAAADRLADAAVEDAARVARHAAALSRRDVLGEARRDVAARLVATECAVADADAAWRGAWAETAVSPAAPEAMAAWLAAVGGLLTRRDANALRAALVARLDALAATVRPRLAQLAAELGAPAAEGLGVPALAAAVEARLKTLAARFDAARHVGTLIGDAAARIARLEAAETDAAAGDAAWRARCAAALPEAGLPPEATLAMAEAALAAWREAPKALQESVRSARRAEGVARDIRAFEAAAAAVVGRLAPDLAALDPDAGVKLLHERLAAARDAQARRSDAVRRREAAERALALAETLRASADAALAEAAAAFPGDSDLDDLLDRLIARERLRDSLSGRRGHLLAQAEGLDEAALRAELATFDAALAAAEMDELHADEERLDAERDGLVAECDRETRRRAELERGVGAEVAAVQQRGAEAELAAAAREWTVLKLGALLIAKAVERSRAARQDPVVARAGALFATLTGGAFSGFAEAYDESDAPTLVARRASGETVAVAGLSEGTRDQFYLALRLASLEDYAARAEPAPFLGDDLFASFDDARTACALRALAEIGARVQPILFTHHRAVANAALAALGDAADVVSLG